MSILGASNINLLYVLIGRSLPKCNVSEQNLVVHMAPTLQIGPGPNLTPLSYYMESGQRAPDSSIPGWPTSDLPVPDSPIPISPMTSSLFPIHLLPFWARGKTTKYPAVILL